HPRCPRDLGHRARFPAEGPADDIARRAAMAGLPRPGADPPHRRRGGQVDPSPPPPGADAIPTGRSGQPEPSPDIGHHLSPRLTRYQIPCRQHHSRTGEKDARAHEEVPMSETSAESSKADVALEYPESSDAPQPG